MNTPQSHFAALHYLHADAASVLPVELQALSHWITWKAGPIKSDGKFDKIPYG